MVSVIHLNEHKTLGKHDPADLSIVIKPLSKSCNYKLRSIFKNRHSFKGWCGFTFIDHIPDRFSAYIQGNPEKDLGAVLFFDTPDDMLLLVQGIDESFHLIDVEGLTVGSASSLEFLCNNLSKQKPS